MATLQDKINAIANNLLAPVISWCKAHSVALDSAPVLAGILGEDPSTWTIVQVEGLDIVLVASNATRRGVALLEQTPFARLLYSSAKGRSFCFALAGDLRIPGVLQRKILGSFDSAIGIEADAVAPAAEAEAEAPTPYE
ncbi:MAG: hypothetical protein KatS3mg023_3859 [Armatimonadota bacterium]|nr:MAG: hypothetical protein KatS3mg023_3859 [Armatimonadota bacterium]